MSTIRAITMPKWGIEMQEGTITGWHAAPGATLAKGDPLLDVETEKIVNSVESPYDGTLRRIVADERDTVAVGALIAVYADAGVSEAEIDAFVAAFKPADTSFEPDGSAAGGSAEAVGGASSAAPAGAASAGASPGAADSSTDADAGDGGEPRVSPIARRVAERLGVDVSKIKGTGRNGRVSKEDVEAYAAALGVAGAGSSGAESAGTSGPAGIASPSGASASSAPSPAAASGNEPTRERMSSMRATIARRLVESTTTVPHFRVAIDVDVGALRAARATLESSGTKVSINDLLVHAVSRALVRHPDVNAQLQGDEILRFPHADVCVAIATDGGLVAPVVRAADTKSVGAISTEIRDLAERARTGRLTRDEITGGTFTVSNLGMLGVDRFDGIINPPQVALLAVGAATERVVAREGRMAVATIATLTLSCDHRLVDGATGARFLATLRELVERPEVR
jgi:pyruvate dehydrogenase E2 component (dihydrolipoamide acetyltransferase)